MAHLIIVGNNPLLKVATSSIEVANLTEMQVDRQTGDKRPQQLKQLQMLGSSTFRIKMLKLLFQVNFRVKVLKRLQLTRHLYPSTSSINGGKISGTHEPREASKFGIVLDQHVKKVMKQQKL